MNHQEISQKANKKHHEAAITVKIMSKVNCENEPATVKVNEVTKEGFPQSSYEDVEGDKIKRLKRLVNHKATV